VQWLRLVLPWLTSRHMSGQTHIHTLIQTAFWPAYMKSSASWAKNCKKVCG